MDTALESGTLESGTQESGTLVVLQYNAAGSIIEYFILIKGSFWLRAVT